MHLHIKIAYGISDEGEIKIVMEPPNMQLSVTLSSKFAVEPQVFHLTRDIIKIKIRMLQSKNINQI